MKKTASILTALLLCFLLAAPAAALDAQDPAAPEVAAPSAVLIERETGTVLYAKNETERRPPASVTKVMTLLLIAEAVDSGELSLDDMVTGSERAASMGGSQIWLEAGEQLSVSDMIKCVAVVSANDCAVALAEHLCGSEAAFVERMNQRAEELGLENTQFTNCTGLFDDTAHYTCALDIAVMSRELLSHEWIKDYTTIWMDSVRDGKSELTNTNKLVRYYEGCTGLKTGYTSTAMYCLSASAERDGTEYIAVIMHAESIESRNKDASALLDYGFANFRLCPLTSGEELPDVAVELGTEAYVTPVYDGGGAVLLRTKDAQGLSWSLDLPDTVAAPVRAGERLGTLTLSNSSGPVAEVPILAGGTSERLSAPGIFIKLLSMLFCAE
ncbi:MAG: D-alanyl-D-alanine carboxypeptidase family protein [Candidatus Scatomorpha sp.]|jgi:D-alanyl-D-alanine carboxypeptidase (penicillin-binding protein 5/6)